jgi:NADPH-dependent 2,4-dienoyl-CoA reductase/sulfur reductase-like enzyme
MIMRDDRVGKQFFTPEMSRFFEGYFTARGVRLIKEATLAELKGERAVTAVQLTDGRAIECDLVVAGIGAQPATEFLAGSGIDVDNGVVVNEYLETNRTAISAAGDIANYPDILFGKRRRVEHWDNAVAQGQHCAKILMGERTPFKHVPYFFSDVFDLSYEFWGDPAGADRVVHRGDLSTNSFSVWWVRDSVLLAAFAMNRPDEERDLAPKWIETKQRVSADDLKNTALPISQAAANV